MRRTSWMLGLLALPAAALAADSGMKPGLYDYTAKMDMPGMPFEMPPMKYQACVKQEDLDKGNQYKDRNSKDCQISNLKQSAGKASFDITCGDGTTGHAEYTFDENGMTGKTAMKKDAQQMNMSMTAKRAGDCK